LSISWWVFAVGFSHMVSSDFVSAATPSTKYLAPPF
jgi:hypothetical protein